MKPRYNLRFQPIKPLLSIPKKKAASRSASRVVKKSKPRRANPVITEPIRRHSLRLKPVVKKAGSRASIDTPRWRKVENESDDDSLSSDEDEDDLDELLARHRRLTLEEQKDRKLYERYVRAQRTLRRLQCRRTHTAHLTESTRKRLLRELERDRRYEIHDKICAYLANRTILFRHACYKESKQPMNWTTLEEEVPRNRNVGTIHELDVMIENLKRAARYSKSPLSKSRLSVRERQNRRLKTMTPLKLDTSQPTEHRSSPALANSMLNPPSPLSIMSYSPRVPLVRFTDDPNMKIRTGPSQRLTCIQNVLSHQNRIATNEIPIRKSLIRSKSSSINSSDWSSPPKKRAVEKENCSVPTHSSSNNPTHSDILLRTTSPMVSIKHPSSSSSSRAYPNTRKHPINSLTTRRHTRLSANV